jgi:hypothetical protein
LFSVTFHGNRYEFIMQYAGSAANSRTNNSVNIVDIEKSLIVSFSFNCIRNEPQRGQKPWRCAQGPLQGLIGTFSG